MKNEVLLLVLLLGVIALSFAESSSSESGIVATEERESDFDRPCNRVPIKKKCYLTMVWEYWRTMCVVLQPNSCGCTDGLPGVKLCSPVPRWDGDETEDYYGCPGWDNKTSSATSNCESLEVDTFTCRGKCEGSTTNPNVPSTTGRMSGCSLVNEPAPYENQCFMRTFNLFDQLEHCVYYEPTGCQCVENNGNRYCRKHSGTNLVLCPRWNGKRDSTNNCANITANVGKVCKGSCAPSLYTTGITTGQTTIDTTGPVSSSRSTTGAAGTSLRSTTNTGLSSASSSPSSTTLTSVGVSSTTSITWSPPVSSSSSNPVVAPSTSLKATPQMNDEEKTQE